MSEEAKPIQLRNSRVIEIYNELSKIPILKDVPKMVHLLGRNMNILRGLIDEMEDTRKKLKPETNGKVLADTDPEMQEFIRKWQEVLDMKVDVTPARFPVSDLDKVDLSPASCAAILKLIEP